MCFDPQPHACLLAAWGLLEPYCLRQTHSLPRGRQEDAMDLTDTPSSSFLPQLAGSANAKKKKKVFFCASELNAD